MKTLRNALKDKLEAANTRIDDLNNQIRPLQQELNTLLSERRDIEKRLNNMKPPHVSDHAVVRYLERVQGINIEEIRANMLSAEVINAMALGAERIKLDGTTLVLKDCAVVTVMD